MILRSRLPLEALEFVKKSHERHTNMNRNLGEVCIIEDKHTAIDVSAHMADSGYLHGINTPLYLYIYVCVCVCVCVCVHITEFTVSRVKRELSINHS